MLRNFWVSSDNLFYTQSDNFEGEIVLIFKKYTETELRFLVKAGIQAYLQSCLRNFHPGWGRGLGTPEVFTTAAESGAILALFLLAHMLTPPHLVCSHCQDRGTCQILKQADILEMYFLRALYCIFQSSPNFHPIHTPGSQSLTLFPRISWATFRSRYFGS